MASKDDLRVTVINWEKFNFRKDIKAASWFRLAHDLFEDPDLFELSHTELLFWIYILCQASKKSSGEVLLNLAHAERIGRFKKTDIETSLKKLELVQCIHVGGTDTLRERNEDVTHTGATDRQTDRQDSTPSSREKRSEINSSELETAYQLYPLKEGKSRGLTKLRREIRTSDDLAQLKIAIENYKRSPNVKKGFVKLFSTFAHEWRDWLDPEAGKTFKSDSKLTLKNPDDLV